MDVKIAQTKEKTAVYDVVIIGSGSAGLPAALYAGRYLLKTAVILGREFGGEIAKAAEIWNYPGFPEGDSYKLMKVMRKQAEEVGAEMVSGSVEKIENADGCYTLNLDDGRTLYTKTVVLATGAERKKLGLPKEDTFHSKGVHYCVTCDGPLFTGKEIAIAGGGDASVKGALLASQYASKIYLLVRGNKMRAEPINQERLNDVADKVQVLYETEVVEILGDDSFHGVRLSNPHEGKETLSVAALFVEIGAIPSTKLAREVGANLDPLGYVEVSNMMETNVPGFYACGDTTNFFGAFKQTITSAAMGTVAVTSAYDYIKKNGTNLCRVHWKPTTNTPGPTS